MRLQSSWKKADIFRRVPKDLTEASLSGAIVSVLCIVVMVLLFSGEVISYAFPRTHSDMVVTKTKGPDQRLKVFIDIDMVKLPCALASVDVVDLLMNHQSDTSDNLVKTPLDERGRPIQDDRTPGEFRSAQEGCRLQGFILVTRVPGNFHISAHGKVHLLRQHFPLGINVDHVIRTLAFEPTEADAPYRYAERGSRPLETTQTSSVAPISYYYYLDVVPTVYSGSFSSTETYQYTVGSKMAPNQVNMAMFSYQLSPIAVQYSSGRVSFTHFLTYICAIIGGVYTVAGLVARFVYNSTAHIQKRFMGKGD